MRRITCDALSKHQLARIKLKIIDLGSLGFRDVMFDKVTEMFAGLQAISWNMVGNGILVSLFFFFWFIVIYFY